MVKRMEKDKGRGNIGIALSMQERMIGTRQYRWAEACKKRWDSGCILKKEPSEHIDELDVGGKKEVTDSSMALD